MKKNILRFVISSLVVLLVFVVFEQMLAFAVVPGCSYVRTQMNDFYKSATPNPHLHLHVRHRYRNAISINGSSYADTEFGHHYQPKKETLLTDDNRKTLLEMMKNFLNQEQK